MRLAFDFRSSSRSLEFRISWDMRNFVCRCLKTLIMHWDDQRGRLEHATWWFLTFMISSTWSSPAITLDTLTRLLEIIFTTESLTFLPFSISQVIYKYERKVRHWFDVFSSFFFSLYQKGIWILFFHFHYQQVKNEQRTSEHKSDQKLNIEHHFSSSLIRNFQSIEFQFAACKFFLSQNSQTRQKKKL